VALLRFSFEIDLLIRFWTFSQKYLRGENEPNSAFLAFLVRCFLGSLATCVPERVPIHMWRHSVTANGLSVLAFLVWDCSRASGECGRFLFGFQSFVVTVDVEVDFVVLMNK
jgi:hypothetical protein